MRLHHIHISSPPDGEDAQRRFYSGGLGLSQVPKPADLAGCGGSERATFTGMIRFHTCDGAGNRVGLMSPAQPAAAT